MTTLDVVLALFCVLAYVAGVALVAWTSGYMAAEKNLKRKDD